MALKNRFEDRLRVIALAELCQLLKARASDLYIAEEARIAEELELEASIELEFQIESRKLMGGWA